jgi:3-methyl-2-oxobutanoate hydroxymethyltransferase
MSTANRKNERITIPDLVARKGAIPIVCLTAYTKPIAELVDQHVDLVLVGDSLGMVLYGMESTIGVTLEMMIAHGQAVARGSRRAAFLVDMPFGSYEESPQQAFRNCSRVMKETGCQGIKLEGGTEMAGTIDFLTSRGIPVLAHVGLRPQSINTVGGFRTQGREKADWSAIIADAVAVAEAGAFATVLEAVAEPLAREITGRVPNLTIGIGASAQCDGQILVTEDLFGLGSWSPKFVKRYAETGKVIDEAVRLYAGEVRERRFPGPEQTYGMKPEPPENRS